MARRLLIKPQSPFAQAVADAFRDTRTIIADDQPHLIAAFGQGQFNATGRPFARVVEKIAEYFVQVMLFDRPATFLRQFRRQLEGLFRVQTAKHPQKIACLFNWIGAFANLWTGKPAAAHFCLKLPVDTIQSRSHLSSQLLIEWPTGVFQNLANRCYWRFDAVGQICKSVSGACQPLIQRIEQLIELLDEGAKLLGALNIDP